MQELQESIAEMSASNVVPKQDRDKYKDDAADCPDNEQIAVEILAELKRNGVTVKHNITDVNITAKTTVKNTGTEVDSNYLFGPEDGFEEDTAEEIERNTNNREVETTLQILKFPENTPEEENHEEEISTEGTKHGSSTANTNQTLNLSPFQRQHRFDLQTNKNSTNNNTTSIQPAQVTIQIIPHNINLQLTNNDKDELLGLELHNLAAIIQDTASTADRQRPEKTLSVVHATISSDKSNTNVSQTNTSNKDVDKDLQPNINAAIHKELNYINETFTYNQSQNVNVANNMEIHGSRITVARNTEERKDNYSSEVSQVPAASTMLLLINQHNNENLPTTAIKENRNSDMNHLSENILLTNHSSHSGQTFNISEKEHATTHGTISLTNTTHKTLENITHSNSNYTESASEVQVPGPLKRLMNLLARKQLDQNDTTANNFISFTRNNSENQATAWVKHRPSIFSTDAIQNMISALNDTKDRDYDIQQQQYLSRLQELATELVNRKNGSALEITDQFKFTNTTHDRKGTISEEGNK